MLSLDRTICLPLQPAVRGIASCILSAALIGCGGGGGGGGSSPPPAAPTAGSPEGLWIGSAAGGRTVTGLVLDDGSFFVLYSGSNRPETIGGIVHGTGTSSGNSFTSTNARDFSFEGLGILNAPVTASFVQRQSFDGVVAYGGQLGSTAFTTRFDAAYDAVPSLTAAAGTFTGQSFSAGGVEASSVTLTSSGGFSGSTSGGCSYSGTAAPRGRGNVFNLSITFGPAPCAFPGQSLSGIAYYDAAARRLYAAAPNTARTGGVFFAGTRPATLPASSTLAQQCAPTNTLAPAGNRNGSLDTEKRWVRSYMDEAYLWYREVPTVDPALPQFSNTGNVTASLDAYFSALLTPARTQSGKLKDEFSFTFPTAEWNALSQGGTVAGYGIEWFLGSPTPPRNLTVAYVDPDTPAARANVTRGMRVVSINGVDIDTNAQAGIATINEGAFSPRPGTSYNFVFRTLVGGTVNATLTAGTVTKVPVQNVRVISTPTGNVGYLTFNDHITPAEGQLVAAFNQLRTANVTDLVLDLRYNGGGFIYIASQVGFMIAGSQRTAGRTFERLRFNDKRVADNNDPSNNIPFFGSTSGFQNSGTTANQPLPQLGLSRVFVLTTDNSCSASESIINGLEGIDLQVIRIGGATCGKPFGFTAKDNCGISYFPIEFQGVNDQGFGEFADGFTPTCRATDDFSKPLGDSTEGMLAAALSFRQTGACPAPDVVQRQSSGAQDSGRLVRSIVRENKYR